MPEPFVSLMRRYCVDYTNSHDLSVCDEIMDAGYVVHITGMTLPRDLSYKPSVEQVFERFPTLGLVVHELVTNGDRLVMRFSEHASTVDGDLACWSGIGLYDWNGTKLTVCRVEQDFWSQQRQLEAHVPDPLDPPHLDPWTTTRAAAPNPSAEEVVRSWLCAGELSRASTGRVDEGDVRAHVPILEATGCEIHDLFSAGEKVAFHASLSGPYRGGLGADVSAHEGHPVRLDLAGLLTVGDGVVRDARVVTDRFGTWMRLVSEPVPA